MGRAASPGNDAKRGVREQGKERRCNAGMTYESIVATSSKSNIWLSRVFPSSSVLLPRSVVSAGDAVTSITVECLAYSCSLCRCLLVAEEKLG